MRYYTFVASNAIKSKFVFLHDPEKKCNGNANNTVFPPNWVSVYENVVSRGLLNSNSTDNLIIVDVEMHLVQLTIFR